MSAAPSDVVLEVDKLGKTFRKPFSRTQVEAVRSVSFQVQRRDIFGFLGPNGAGKTTTLKMLTGLIRPTSGRATVLGKLVPSPEAMGRVGYLPENPYIYPYLSPREFVTLAGRLNGLGGKNLKSRTEAVLERVGIAYAMDRPAKSLSKGMLQRTGLAAALVHDPELLVLDEPMSGLDPVGRKEVRDLIVDERASGRTLFFSSHVLADVEMLCDRVVILKRGSIVAEGRLSELLESETKTCELTLFGVSEECSQQLAKLGTLRTVGAGTVVEIEGDEPLERALRQAMDGGARIESLVRKRQTLEELFVQRAV